MKKAYPKQTTENEKQVFEHSEKTSLRINKFLTAAGVCSRRQADKFIEEKRVAIDGVTAEVGSKVFALQTVTLDGKTVQQQQQHVYVALNKPVGIACTLEQDKADNISDFMNFHCRIFPIGRLDKDSSGLILLTSDGDIVNKILRAENNHEKEYVVRVNREIKPDFIKKIQAGVEITNMRNKKRERTKPCTAQQIAPQTFKIILTQGLNRQIRRMCTELGYRVTNLQRVRIMNITLGDLKVGQWRYLTQQELDTLGASLNSESGE